MKIKFLLDQNPGQAYLKTLFVHQYLRSITFLFLIRSIASLPFSFQLTGSNINLGVLVYEPPRKGPTLWEIGIPDRSAAEFFVPDPYPTLANQLYTNHPEKSALNYHAQNLVVTQFSLMLHLLKFQYLIVAYRFRQYGLWERYVDLYRNDDLEYTVGDSYHEKDWFFAHVTRCLFHPYRPRRLPSDFPFSRTLYSIK